MHVGQTLPSCKLRTRSWSSNPRHRSAFSKWTPLASEGACAMLRKTMIILATAIALTAGLSADAFARGGGGGGGHSGVDTVVASVAATVSAVALMWAAALVAVLTSAGLAVALTSAALAELMSAVLAGRSLAALRVSTSPRRPAISAT